MDFKTALQNNNQNEIIRCVKSVGAETPTPDYFCCPASLLRQVAGY